MATKGSSTGLTPAPALTATDTAHQGERRHRCPTAYGDGQAASEAGRKYRQSEVE